MVTRGATDGTWPLASGTWRAGSTPRADYKLLATALEHEPSEALPAADLRALFHAPADGPLYPPEFLFSPADGRTLERPAEASPWIAPFGAPPVTPAAPVHARGLLRCAQPLRLAALRAVREEPAPPDARLAQVPPGHYEFFSLRAATAAPVLLALDPDQGVPLAYLPCSRRWEPLVHPQDRLPAPSGLPRASWRCEVAQGRKGCRLLLPTQAGLVRLLPDVPALRFELEDMGDAPAVGSPIQFGRQVWLPLRCADGGVQLAGIDAHTTPVLLPLAGGPRAAMAEPLQAPVSTAQWAVWPGAAGQLRLRRRDDAFEADFLPWPEGLGPVFDFGCPYLARTGKLWQLCEDARAGGQFVYLQLGEDHAERWTLSTPRSCSGRVSFRSAVRDRDLPWEEPLHADDGREPRVMLPLLESEKTGAVVGLRVPVLRGLRGVFEPPARKPCELLLDDPRDGEQVLLDLSRVSEPWRTRLFVHDGHLWAYHPELDAIPGWRLAP